MVIVGVYVDRVRTQIGLEEIYDHPQTAGVTVAVLDSGVSRHPDLFGKVIAFKDFVNGKKQMYDDNGHGTHICGIICGSGAMSKGRYRGIATRSRLVVAKVLDHKGEGMASHMLEALTWILINRELFQIRIVNISVGIGNMTDIQKEEALRDKIEEVWESGIVVVCAAGNKGPANNSISAVGESSKIITVGCHDGEYYRDNPKSCETYSGRGQLKSIVRKPDLVAPGTDICSCNFIKSKFRNTDYYTVKSGTSMATPIIAGAAALLLERNPHLSNENVKLRMTYTADDLGLPWNQQGWGMVNIKKLLEKY